MPFCWHRVISFTFTFLAFFFWLLLRNLDLTIFVFCGVFTPVSWPSALWIQCAPRLTYFHMETMSHTPGYHFLYKFMIFLFSLKLCSTTATSWTVAHQDPLSKRFSRQEARILEWTAISFSRLWRLSKALKLSSDDISTLRKDCLI